MRLWLALRILALIHPLLTTSELGGAESLHLVTTAIPWLLLLLLTDFGHSHGRQQKSVRAATDGTQSSPLPTTFPLASGGCSVDLSHLMCLCNVLQLEVGTYFVLSIKS